MNRILCACVAWCASLPAAVLADDSGQPGHSTVHVVFITSHSQQMFAGGGMGGIDIQQPMVRVGDVVVPASGVRLIKISIDGDFVGHAMVGTWDIKPVFVLAEGNRKFTFTIDGFEPVTSEIKVLGTNSTQYLIVKLPSEKLEAKSTGVLGDASTVQPGRPAVSPP